MGMDRGICPKCGSRTTTKEKITGQYTLDLICLNCKYTGHNTEFRPVTKKKPSTVNEILPFLEKAIRIGSIAAQNHVNKLYTERDDFSKHDATGVHSLLLQVDARSKLYKELLKLEHDQIITFENSISKGIDIVLRYTFELNENDKRVNPQEISIYEAADSMANDFLSEHLDLKLYNTSMLS